MDWRDIKGIIFDYGGTLDTHGRHWVHVLREGWHAAGMQVPEEEFRAAYIHGERALAVDGAVEPTDRFHDVLLKKTLVAMASIAHLERYYTGEDPFVADRVAADIADRCDAAAAHWTAQSAALLKHLSRKYKLCLVSNFYGNLRTVLQAYGLKHYFPHIIESAAVNVRKPDPRIFELGVEAMGLRPEQVLVVGDSLSKDIRPAQAIGCHTIWLKGQGWEDGAARRDAPSPHRQQ